MNDRTKYRYRVALGAFIIAAVIFLVFRYFFKGPPFIKIAALAGIGVTIYLVMSLIINKNRNKK